MINEFERNTIAEIKALIQSGQPVADWQKQMILDLVRREGLPLTSAAVQNAIKDGFDTTGIRVAA